MGRRNYVRVAVEGPQEAALHPLIVQTRLRVVRVERLLIFGIRGEFGLHLLHRREPGVAGQHQKERAVGCYVTGQHAGGTGPGALERGHLLFQKIVVPLPLVVRAVTQLDPTQLEDDVLSGIGGRRIARRERGCCGSGPT